MKKVREKEQKALAGSQQATTRVARRGEPKIGVEEFMSVAERFGLSKSTLKQIRAIVAKEDWGEGPFFANYYSPLKETKVQAFQRAARELFKVKFALGTSSGTGALHSAMVAAGVGPGTEVICPAIGFFATSASVVTSGGVPIFCDVDHSLHMDPKKLEALITPRTVAIAPTHVMGGVCDMDPIMKIARKHKLVVIEDCAQSCGATYKGKPVGTIGDIGIFSIAAYKIVGAGEGGLLISNDKHLFDRANALAECGGLWRPERFALPRYEGEIYCGSNYRMSELEAAVDVVQMRKMPAMIKRFRAVKKNMAKYLKTYREILPQKSNEPQGEIGYLLRFFPETFELGERLVKSLQKAGIACGMRGKNAGPDWHIYSYMYPVMLKTKATEHGCAFHCPHYAAKGGNVEYARGDCPVADDLFDRVININLNQWYSAADCKDLATRMNAVFSSCCTEDKSGAPWL
ncbi:MAG: DegT/DnrJ/EryC1/StrS family aminotransferase [Candidatus Hydrogenedentes bacterium]|nr:DegT/DnrJ/EryC1/StrS family aminotransferase [Candidatus Hydrogenedentota bacterium]